jgi:hypothetical protein
MALRYATFPAVYLAVAGGTTCRNVHELTARIVAASSGQASKHGGKKRWKKVTASAFDVSRAALNLRQGDFT